MMSDHREERTGMTRYRFHCTNGSECILDAEGSLVRCPAGLARRARTVAEATMQSVGAVDWAGWQVSVHDLTGRRVWVEPFVTQDLCRKRTRLWRLRPGWVVAEAIDRPTGHSLARKVS